MIKKILLFLLLIPAIAYAVTFCSITLNLSDLGGGTSFRNTSVRFELKNYGNSPPRAISAFYFVPTSRTFYPSTTGLVAGQLIGNDNVTPNGTYYTMTVFNAGNPTYSCNLVITGTTDNINTASCLANTDLPPAGNPDLNFYYNGTFVKNRPGVNFIPGSGSTIVVADDNSHNRINVTVSSTSAGGGLTSFTVGNLNNLFTATLGSNPTTSPVLAFTPVNWSAYSFLANNTGSSAIPSIVPFDILFGNCPSALTYSTSTHLFGCNSSSGALADPGSNGIVFRSALNTTRVITFADIVAYFAGGTCNGFLYFDGTCTAPGAGVVTNVTGTSPVVSSGGATPAISMPLATNSVPGYLSAADHTTFNAKQAALSSYTTIVGLWAGGCSGFLKSDGTCAVSSGLSDPGSNGIIKRTALNTTAVITYADIVPLFSGCTGTNYLGADGNCHAAATLPTLGTSGACLGSLSGSLAYQNCYGNGTTMLDASKFASIQAALNICNTNTGIDIFVPPGSFTLPAGLTTSCGNVDFSGGGGQGDEISSASPNAMCPTTLVVPSGQVGFTFNGSAGSTLFRGPHIHDICFVGASGALGGILIKRSNNFVIERTGISYFATGYGIKSDGTGNLNQYGVITNNTITGNMTDIWSILNSGLRITNNHLDNAHNSGSPAASTRGIYNNCPASSQNETSIIQGNVILGSDILVDVECGTGDVIGPNRYEGFITAAVRLRDLNSNLAMGMQVLGGSISNFINGSIGTGIIVGTGVSGTFVQIHSVLNVVAAISSADSSTQWMLPGSNNLTGLGIVIPNTTVTVPTSTTVGANSNVVQTPISMSGVLSSCAVLPFTATTNTSGVVGWGNNGGLEIQPWPTANTVNWQIINPTGSSITTTGSVTFNVAVYCH